MELLVVITIIGILISLLLPAVQAAREAARQMQCKNNLKQIALGCLGHEEVHNWFPTGGWGWGWAGDPDRGFTKLQPGGWPYNILQFIEQPALRDMGMGMTIGDKRVAGRIAAETPLSVFNCPTRRAAITYPYVHTSAYYNIQRPELCGRSDYAACSGSENGSVGIARGPATLAEGDKPDFTSESWPVVTNTSNGIVYLRSEVGMADITDGTSKTYLLGEKYLSPDCYATGKYEGDDQGWNVGYDLDINRWVQYPALQDKPGYWNSAIFGSAHSNGFHMALCDGSVHVINYTINLEVHRCLGNRKDGEVIDAKTF